MNPPSKKLPQGSAVDWTLYVQKPGAKKGEFLETVADWNMRDQYTRVIDGETYWASYIDTLDHWVVYTPKPLSATW